MSAQSNEAVFSDGQLEHRIFAVTPLGAADEKLLLELAKTSAYPVLDVGWVWNDTVEAYLRRLTSRLRRSFGLRISAAVTLPEDFATRFAGNISTVIFSSIEDYQRQSARVTGMQVVCEVVSVEEALAADKLGLQGLIVKGNEAGGRVGELASFIFMQQIAGKLNTPYWVQGGMGPFSALAAVYSGAMGVVYDSQFALMSKWSRHRTVTPVLKTLNGSETEVVHGYRFVKHGLFTSLHDYDNQAEMLQQIAGAEKPVVMAGMDISLASVFAEAYHDPQTLIHVTEVALAGRLDQLDSNVFAENSAFAKALGLRYPIVQGPMTRVSDEPAFAKAVATEGALPSIACAVLRPDKLDAILAQTAEQLDGQPWAAGLLGFMPPEVLKPQIDVVMKHKPAAVVLAGGRSEQCKQFVDNDIVPIVHCPTANLFKQFLKDGVEYFIFEGRECGGHIGPLSSMTLWEMQCTLAIDYNKPEQLNLIFAGGIHDTLSAQMVSAMVSPLAQRGIKVGLLAGTAYIFCEEAVSSGAVLQNFQNKAVENNETAVVETGVGHITRCLKTDYVDYLAAERKKMEADGLSKQEIFIALEQLNVGHLRIASKGVKRDGDQLIQVPEAEQNSKGMFMIGDVALMRDAVTSIDKLHQALSHLAYDRTLINNAKARLDQSKQDTDNCAIAVVGMAARFAGSGSIDEYWLNILEGKDLVTEVDDSRWPKDLYFDPNTRSGENEKSYSKWGAFIDEFEIDPTEFGIPPQTLSAIDAGQLAALKVSKDALVDAGYTDPERLHNTSVIFGYEPGGEISGAYAMRILMNQIAQDHPELLAEARRNTPNLSEDSFAGILGNVLAGRVSNRLNLGGQNFTIDAACASSLAAIDSAIKELRYGESDMVIAGGVDFHNGIQDYIMFCSTYALSHKGKCFSFSDEADGIALGEGMAAVVLKRLEDAEADGDTIYGVIEGIAGSSDGKSLGLTAPRREGQKFALNRAYQRAGISPKSIGLVEAHGTGTVVGDRTELTALEEVYQWAGTDNQSVALGTVKTQIGHTKCAAGVASLIKGVLATQYGVLPPTLNIETPNAKYNPEQSPFALNNRAIPWQSGSRLAGVSSFGFGGTNYHAVVGNNKQVNDLDKMTPNLRSHEWFTFTGDSMQAALASVAKLTHFIEQSTSDLSLANLAWSQFKQNDIAQPVQISIIATDVDDLLTKLKQAAQQKAVIGSVFIRQLEQQYSAAETAFLFAGQGSQFVDMGRELFNYFPALRQYLPQSKALLDKWFPATAFTDEARQEQLAAITQTQVTQPLLGMLAHAVAHLLNACGVEADNAAGHSYGELAALAYADAIPFENLVALSEARAQAIIDSSKEAGGMLAVACDATKAEAILGLADAPALTVANQNSPLQTVLTGTRHEAEAGKAFFDAQQIKSTLINTPYAFHSPLIADAEKQFKASLQANKLQALQKQVWSNLTAKPYAAKQSAKSISNLAKQIISPVRYQEMINDMRAKGVKVFIEVGSGAIQSRLVGDILADHADYLSFSTVQNGQSALKSVLQTLAQLSVSGVACNPAYLYAHRQLSEYDLDQALQRKKSTWLVNGQYARPMIGEVAESGYLPARVGSVKIPVDYGKGAAAPVAADQQTREQVMSHYLSTVNHFVDQQKQVMMQYLGATPTESFTNPQPVVMPAASAPAPAAVTAQVVEPVRNEVVHAAPAIPQVTIQDITAQVTAAIAEKTGYPEEMIEPELDLESDLGIDSIKRMELLASLAERLGVPMDSEAMADSAEDSTELLKEVASLKTATQISTWMHKVIQEAQAAASAQMTPTQPAITQSTQATTSVVAVVSMTIEQIVAEVTAAIAEKTGYPEDMIEPELDLESDLGIDSIKRMELLASLAERLGVPMDSEAMADSAEDSTELLKEVASLKTATQISPWMHKVLQDAQATTAAVTPTAPQVADTPSQQAPTKQAPEVVAAATPVATFSVQEIVVKVTAAIAEKTGYPEEMIEPELDLESDLGIDSIKRMELLASLAERLGIAMDSDAMANSAEDSTELLKEVASLKTATQISTWMHAALTEASDGGEMHVEVEVANEPKMLDLTADEDALSKMVRYETQFNQCDLELGELPEIGQHALVISADDSTVFESALAKRVSRVSHVSLADFSATDLAGHDAIFVLLSQDSSRDEPSFDSFATVFSLLKSVSPSQLKSVTVLNQCPVSKITVDDKALYPMEPNGFAGLVAALRREWPKVSLACVYLCKDSEPDQQRWVDYAYQEHQLQEQEGNGYFYRPALYYQNTIYRRSLVEVPFEPAEQPVLTKDDVLVVVGGAKGITQWTAVELAKQYGCHMVILGRSAFDEADLDSFVERSVDQIRQQIVAEFAGKKSLAEIQKMVNAEEQRQLLVAGIQELQSYVNSVSYYQVNTNHVEQLDLVMAKIIARYGRISGCVYGAGAIRDKFISDKTLADAQIVYDVKTSAYCNFVHAVMRVAKPYFMIAYSSISAILGSRGQTDYGAANEALEYASQVLGNQYQQTRFSTVGWGPWTGIGMVDSALEEHLSRYEIYAIERQEGAQFLANEVASIGMGNSRCFAFKKR